MYNSGDLAVAYWLVLPKSVLFSGLLKSLFPAVGIKNMAAPPMPSTSGRIIRIKINQPTRNCNMVRYFIRVKNRCLATLSTFLFVICGPECTPFPSSMFRLSNSAFDCDKPLVWFRYVSKATWMSWSSWVCSASSARKHLNKVSNNRIVRKVYSSLGAFTKYQSVYTCFNKKSAWQECFLRTWHNAHYTCRIQLEKGLLFHVAGSQSEHTDWIRKGYFFDWALQCLEWFAKTWTVQLFTFSPINIHSLWILSYCLRNKREKTFLQNVRVWPHQCTCNLYLVSGTPPLM